MVTGSRLDAPMMTSTAPERECVAAQHRPFPTAVAGFGYLSACFSRPYPVCGFGPVKGHGSGCPSP